MKGHLKQIIGIGIAPKYGEKIADYDTFKKTKMDWSLDHQHHNNGYAARS